MILSYTYAVYREIVKANLPSQRLLEDLEAALNTPDPEARKRETLAQLEKIASVVLVRLETNVEQSRLLFYALASAVADPRADDFYVELGAAYVRLVPYTKHKESLGIPLDIGKRMVDLRRDHPTEVRRSSLDLS